MDRSSIKSTQNREKGFALAVVLIILATGSLLIPPWLCHVYTGLCASQISETRMIDQTSASAGVNHAIWRLNTNDGGLADLLSVENPSVNYTTAINGTEVSIKVEIPSFPDPPPPPPTASGQNLYVSGNSSTKWVKPNESKTFTYTVNMTNYGTSTLHVGEIGDMIPPPFQYIAGSSSGLTTADPTITIENNRQILLWAFTGTKPTLPAGQTTVQTFQVTHLPAGVGVYYSETWGEDFPVSLGKVSSGPTAPVAVGVYNISTRAAQATTESQAAVSSTEMIILSWEE